MFESIMNFFKRFGKNEKEHSKEAAKERLHLVLAQDRANISADFLEMMKQEIIEVIKKYIDIDEEAIDVRMTNKPGEDGTVGAPALYANIPIVTIKNDARKLKGTIEGKEEEKGKNQNDDEEETIVDQEKSSNEKIENETSKIGNIERNEKTNQTETNLEENNIKDEKTEKQEENTKLAENETENMETSKVEEKTKEIIKESAKSNHNKKTSNHKNEKRKK